MGIDFGEYRSGRIENGKPKFGQCALVIGNFANEPDTLLRLTNPKQLLFTDVAAVENLSGPTRATLTFGAFFIDYDLDGQLDYLANNGHLEPEINKVQPSQHYDQPVQLFWNTGDVPAFEEAGPVQCGDDLFLPHVGRGSAFADIDGNGTLDLLLMANGGPAKLLKNAGLAGNNWVRFALEGNGKNTNRSAIGARVTLTAGNQVYKRELVGTRGYLSSSELVLTFGLGRAKTIDRVEIVWPGSDTTPQVITDLAINKMHRIVQK
jgi:enediyne biosynthesis protein E4